ncbi:MAG: hypothetical protein VX913_06525 [Planctomycetota bacterium]|nr:hypothetical protein [Planctomycetota bacterium]
MRQAIFVCLLLPSVILQSVAQRPVRPAKSWLHAALLDRVGVVVRARLDSDEILPLHEIQVTRFKVLETFKGAARDHVLVGAAGARGGAFKDLDKILFLKPLKSGSIHELVDVVDLTPRDEIVVPKTLRAYFRIAAEKLPAMRARSLFNLSLTNVETRSVFATRVAYNELLRLADETSFLFKVEHLDRIQRCRETAPRASRATLTRLSRKISRLLGAHLMGAEEAFPPGPARAELRTAISQFRRMQAPENRVSMMDSMAAAAKSRLRRFCEGAMLDESPVVRTRAAWYLGEFGAERSLAARTRDHSGSTGDELSARIEAIGKTGLADGLQPVLVFLGAESSVDAVLLAIARIGGIDASNVLERVERTLVGRPGEEERLRRIRYYRSESFAPAEAKRRRDAKKAWL